MEVNLNIPSDKAQRDYQLVCRARENGDQRAYADLMRMYREPIYLMLLKMTNNATEADDLTIEAFGKAFSSLHLYTPTHAFSTWLYVILRRICISELRRLRRSPKLLEAEELANWPADSAETEYLTRWEQNSRLMRLAELNGQERLLLLGQTVGGKSTRELAQELGLTPGQVRIRLHRIRRRLRKGEEGEP